MRRLLLLIYFSIVTNPFTTYAQSIESLQPISNIYDDRVIKIISDKEDNFYVIGYIGKGDGNDLNNKVIDDTYFANIPKKISGSFIAKYNGKENQLIWIKQHTSYTLMPAYLDGIVDPEGNVYITGRADYSNFVLEKLDRNGNLLWEKKYKSKTIFNDFVGYGVTVDKQGNSYIVGSFDGANIDGFAFNLNSTKLNAQTDFLIKFNPDGKALWVKTTLNENINYTSITIDNSGNLVTSGSFIGKVNFNDIELENSSPDDGYGKVDNAFLVKRDPNGNILWAKSYPLKANTLNQLVLDYDNVAIDHNNNIYFTSVFSLEKPAKVKVDELELELSSGTVLIKLNPDGKAEWGVNYQSIDADTYQPGKLIYANQAIYLTGIFYGSMNIENETLKNTSPGGSIFLIKLNLNGKKVWATRFGGINNSLYPTLTFLPQQRKLTLASRFYDKMTVNNLSVISKGQGDIFIAKINDTTITTTNYNTTIRGKVFDDSNKNCVEDKTEKGIPNIVLEIQPGEYYTVTDEQGLYAVAVPPGIYTVKPILPTTTKSRIIRNCVSSLEAKTDSLHKEVANINFGYTTIPCTVLTVDIAADRRRRCFRSQTTVTFANEGAADAQNVQVKVIYPKYVVPISSTVPWNFQKDSLLVFTIGQLKAGEKRSFIITDSTVCGNENIRGLSQCVKAMITPKSTCMTPNPNWNQASVAVMGTYQEETETATFIVENTGDGAMTDSTSYRVFANETLVEEGKTKLDKGDKLTLEIPMKSQALRVEADQVKDHPGSSRPNATVQPMMAMPDAPPTPEDAFYQDDADADVEISCLPIIDSYDPNDKQVSPIGITKRHYIKATDELEYLIRFQNTGTDVAYKVVVVDTLSEELDIASLRVGAASHPFIYTVSGKGKPVLTFTFNNINLPDHKTNEPASHGFVKFTIAQTPDNPKGTRIINAAYNYFDYNAPVKTNEVFNIVGDTVMLATEKTVVYDCGKDLPTTAHTLEDINLCDTDNTTLTGNQPEKGKGRWQLISGQATLVNPDNYITKIKNIGYGDVIVEWTIQLCEKVSRSRVTLHRLPVPEPPLVDDIAPQCELSPQAITVFGQNITWYADAEKTIMLYSGNIYQPETISENTTYYVTQTVNGCESAVTTVTLPVQPATINFTVTGDTLTAPFAEQYQWFFNNEPLKAGNTQKIQARNSGLYRVEIIKQNCTASSKDQMHQVYLTQSQLLVKPNPIDEQLNLELTTYSTGEVLIRVWNQLGRKVKEEVTNKPTTVYETQLQLHHLAAGVYFVEAQIGTEVFRQKFVKK
ncbi:DUF7619 domain-containing protein [Adhaeribacter pallidiroseus]|uniref:Secretion system C-terminal sorting domain-containing protein n=1 Tax=Adhaeribacter pallidiroseus TaxID=2072847 RepID=A0A369Q9S7_9BACT|nr:T9SS type A sorting domain-containing protein [Adhaeribacter pallidiroseus]RDC61641.1 hypothetical protein AHMF7616_00221 [Adhaeribacter pallidiroseus]